MQKPDVRAPVHVAGVCVHINDYPEVYNFPQTVEHAADEVCSNQNAC